MAVKPHAVASFFAGDEWTIIGELSDPYGNPYDPSLASSIEWKLDDLEGVTNKATIELGSGVSLITFAGWSVPAVEVKVPASITAPLLGMYRDQIRVTVEGVPQTFWYGPIQVMAPIR